MPIAVWMPKYLTGNAAVDRQHQRLFELVNELHHGIVSGQGREVVGPVLKSLAAYTVDHFATEEGFMRSAQYVNYDRHKAKHDQLTAQVKDLVAQYESGMPNLPGSLSRFLADWLTHHIKEEDLEMITWLRQRGA